MLIDSEEIQKLTARIREASAATAAARSREDVEEYSRLAALLAGLREQRVYLRCRDMIAAAVAKDKA